MSFRLKEQQGRWEKLVVGELVRLLEKAVKMIKFVLYCDSYCVAVAIILVPQEDLRV